jgi:predicted nucleotide-binding protein (sugar kinase/HSP70/actin superfamily)
VANLELLRKINQRHFRVETLEMIPATVRRQSLQQLSFPQQSHWHITNEEYGALLHFAQRPDITGIVYLIPFNCGPDFLVEEMVVSRIRSRKPISILSIDESTGEAGVTTRLDAFIDMLKK